MAVSLGAVVLQVPNIDRSAAFWSQALGYDAQPDNPAFLGPKDGPGSRLHLDETDRTHLDLWVDRATSTLDAEVDRLISLGATRVEDWTYPPNAAFVVLASPDGTLFCVIE
jgi:catechol 2,3-dioxygenase-like lactoylglutathione lyase family enzyme